MPKSCCDYCDTRLTHNSPVRKTHCSGRKHAENVKDYCRKWMEEQAQSLTDKTTTAFPHGEIPPTPFSAPAGAMIPPPPSLPRPPRPGMRPAPHMGGPSMMSTMDPPLPGMMSVGPAWDEATYGRAYANDAWIPNDETSCPSHDGAPSARNDSTRQIRREGSLFLSVFYDLF